MPYPIFKSNKMSISFNESRYPFAEYTHIERIMFYTHRPLKILFHK